MEDTRVFADVLESIVDSIRLTGNITASVENPSGTYLLSSSNELENSEYVKIDNTEYEVSEVTADSFKIQATSGLDFTGKTWKACAPYFLYGHYQSIADELMAMDQSVQHRDQKYPLVLLGIDPNYRERELSGQQYSVSGNIYILEETKREWFTSERFNNVFKATLYPLYSKLLNAIFDSIYVNSTLVEIQPEVEPIPYWGTQQVMGSNKKVVEDPLDAIRFELRELIIRKICK